MDNAIFSVLQDNIGLSVLTIHCGSVTKADIGHNIKSYNFNIILLDLHLTELEKKLHTMEPKKLQISFSEFLCFKNTPSQILVHFCTLHDFFLRQFIN